MKSVAGKLLVLLFVLTVVSVFSGYAQLWNPITFTAPSAFVVEKTTFPAGSYTIRPFLDDTDALQLVSSTGHSTIFACEAQGTSTSKSELTFHRYPDGLYLKQIASNGSSCWVPAGPQEKKSKKSAKPTPETLTASTK